MGDGSLFRLRWPEHHREAAETADRSLDGGGCRVLGPSTSRVRFPIVGVEAAAATALRWNKSTRALPRPSGVCLLHHRRARGGGAHYVRNCYRHNLTG